jgi:hypothetical protein
MPAISTLPGLFNDIKTKFEGTNQEVTNFIQFLNFIQSQGMMNDFTILSQFTSPLRFYNTFSVIEDLSPQGEKDLR